MGKGRSPCCDKTQVKRGPWSPAEDLRLITFIQKYGHENWRALPRQAGLLRCGKSCRLRWINYLRPDVKRGNFTKEEEDSIMRLHETVGNKWSRIAAHFPGRTDNEIKNVWNTHLKKRLGFKNAENSGDDQSKELSSITSSSSSSSSGTSFLSSAKPSNGGRDQYEHQSQDQESMAKINKPPEPTRLTIQAEQAQLDANKGLKELTSFSVSSYGSNNNGSTSTSSQVGINSMPEDDHQPMDLLFDFAGLYDIDPNKLQEVSDYDFWDMLDVFGASESNEVHFPDQPDLANYQSSNIGLVENENWLGYLENELGLDHQATTKTTYQTNQEFVTKDTTEQLVPETFHCDKLPKPAADQSHDQGMGCNFHQMWPSLPHNSAF